MASSSVSAAAARVASEQSAATLALANTSKRDKLREIEKAQQRRWDQAKVFEATAPGSEDASLDTLSESELRAKYPKFFGTFPYAYMNGSLHLGHGFTISKIEFANGFERMMGKRCLFPVGFHCTGMPIKSSADKLIREMEMFGADFEGFQEDSEDAASVPVASQPATSEDKSGATTSITTGSIDKSKKSKVAAKSTGLTYQFQIMESIGVPRAEIKKFADTQHWLDYFPPIATKDLRDLGARVDWRRSFLTTDVNPYYDSFVRWQMNKLHALEYIKFGERYTIFSPKDGQPCMDHDRQSGEGVGPQEYTGIKMEVVEWSAEANEQLPSAVQGKKVYLVAATLRPETMYGQTNCFVGTAIDYGLFASKEQDAFYLCTYRAARNMAYQGILRTRDQVEKVGSLPGKALVGTKIHAPFSLAPKSEVYVLPMENVLASKGTGVVTSVPSDSPDDFATLQDLRKKAEFYKIDSAWVALDPIPVINTPTYGDLTAPTLVKQFKINSQKDVKQLAEAKELAYREGFYSGKMIVGNFKGAKVEDAKIKVRDELIQAGLAFVYSEPESLIMSRSADECIVALCDQWYMAYGDETWKNKARELLARMNTYNDETRNAFNGTLNWLREWACARSYGLGTKLPWDQQFKVESLSDSTIYMSYYTICHLLHSSIDGHQVGPLGITADQLTDEAWDYIFGMSNSCPSVLPTEKAAALKREYEYWYPMDVRSSGKDLINNHLSFCIYVHAALFPESKWPLSMRANGHLMLNGKKMSKSTGNSLTLANAIEKFGADATRLALADAGDGIEDANFEEYTANASILRLHTFLDWCEEVTKGQDQYRQGEFNFFDRIFENAINSAIVKTKEAYSTALYKEALKFGLYEMLLIRDWYREAVTKQGSADSETPVGMHRDLLLRFVRIEALLILPVAPHASEHIWSDLLGEKQSIQLARFPEPSKAVDAALTDAELYIKELVKGVRDAELGQQKKKAKGKGSATFDPNLPKSVSVFVAQSYPEWQTKAIELVKASFDPATNQTDRTKLKAKTIEAGLMKDKRIMPFCVNLQAQIDAMGLDKATSRTSSFNELETLQICSAYIARQLGFAEVKFIAVEDQGTSDNIEVQRAVEQAEPGKPTFVLSNL